MEKALQTKAESPLRRLKKLVQRLWLESILELHILVSLFEAMWASLHLKQALLLPPARMWTPVEFRLYETGQQVQGELT